MAASGLNKKYLHNPAQIVLNRTGRDPPRRPFLMPDPMRYRLEHYPLIIEQVVTWGDMDAHGHVNNVIYFRYMENARVEFYRRIGKYEFEERTGITLVVKSTSCRYIAPLSCPDRISIGARVADINDEQILMQYIIVNAGTNQVAALGDAAIVALQAGDRSRVVFPEELRARISELQKKDNPFSSPT
jgi:acyl-CoA thioester hydrolase